MKTKKLISVIALFALVIACLCLSSCSKNSISGTYHLKCRYANDKLYELGDVYEGTTLDKNSITFKVNDDNTFTYSVLSSGKKVEAKSIWYEIADEGYYGFYIEGEYLTATVRDNRIVIASGSSAIILEK